MPSALNVNVQVQDGTLVLTDRAGQTVTFSTEHTVQQKVSMIALGERCGLPTRQRATGCGFKTRTSSYDSRHAVLTGAPEDLLPTRTGPHTRSKRPKAVEALLLRTRFETAGQRYARAETFTQRGFPVSARLVGRVLAAYGLSKQNGCHRPHALPASWPKRRSTSSTAPASRVHASLPGTTANMTAPPCAHAGAPRPALVAFASSPLSSHWAPLTSSRLEARSSRKGSRRSASPAASSLRRCSGLRRAVAPSIPSAALTSASSLAFRFSPRHRPRSAFSRPSPSRAAWMSRPYWADVWSHAAT